ncbi:MAG: hypothetical protein KDD16_09750 [Mangrovimonas sp.]|nr:hypothetical protein [Mangrovimonas sp.]MCB0451059.1 hypothetical protein [Confluentibacter sp.]
MKKKNNILGALFLISIYCFGIGFSAQKTASHYELIETGNKHEKQFSSLSNALCFHTQTSETVLSGITEYASPNFNQNFEGFWAITFSTELRLYALFKQYKTYFKTILVRYKKTDLIFPFHNFW